MYACKTSYMLLQANLTSYLRQQTSPHTNPFKADLKHGGHPSIAIGTSWHPSTQVTSKGMPLPAVEADPISPQGVEGWGGGVGGGVGWRGVEGWGGEGGGEGGVGRVGWGGVGWGDAAQPHPHRGLNHWQPTLICCYLLGVIVITAQHKTSSMSLYTQKDVLPLRCPLLLLFPWGKIQ
jgi:hypothetical protein